jgi:hypothetical protein
MTDANIWRYKLKNMHGTSDISWINTVNVISHKNRVYGNYLHVSTQSLEKIDNRQNYSRWLTANTTAYFMRGLRTNYSTVARFGNESLSLLWRGLNENKFHACLNKRCCLYESSYRSEGTDSVHTSFTLCAQHAGLTIENTDEKFSGNE